MSILNSCNAVFSVCIQFGLDSLGLKPNELFCFCLLIINVLARTHHISQSRRVWCDVTEMIGSLVQLLKMKLVWFLFSISDALHLDLLQEHEPSVLKVREFRQERGDYRCFTDQWTDQQLYYYFKGLCLSCPYSVCLTVIIKQTLMTFNRL